MRGKAKASTPHKTTITMNEDFHLTRTSILQGKWFDPEMITIHMKFADEIEFCWITSIIELSMN